MTLAPTRCTARLLPCALALVVLAGCALLAPREPAPSLFTLEPELAGSAAPAPVAGAPELGIATPSARPGFDEAGMAYVTRAYEIRYFARHRWVEPPARLLAPLLARTLERAGQRPVPAGQGLAPRLRLETGIETLQQEFTAQPSQLRFALRAQLVDAVEQRVLAARTFEAVEPAPAEDPYGGVVAANRAVARVLEELAAWCAARLASAGSP